MSILNTGKSKAHAIPETSKLKPHQGNGALWAHSLKSQKVTDA